MDDGDGAPWALRVTAAKSDSETAQARLQGIVNYVGADASGLELKTDTAAYGTDLEPLWNHCKIPEIAILQDLTTYFDRHHARNDTPDAINIDGLTRTTQLFIKLAQALASGSATPYRPPAWHRKPKC